MRKWILSAFRGNSSARCTDNATAIAIENEESVPASTMNDASVADQIKVVRAHFGPMLIYSGDMVIGESLRTTGAFEETQIKEVVEFLQDNFPFTPHTFIDIGANIGTHLIYALRSGMFAEGIGIEADPGNFKLLSCNAILNDLALRTRLHNCALSDREGHLEFELSHTNYGDHRVRNYVEPQGNYFGEHDRKVVTIAARTLDQVIDIDDIPARNSLIWMDVQGYEGQILKGGARLLQNGQRPYLVTEFWPYGIEQANGKDSYMEFMESCRKIYDVREPNWRSGKGISFAQLKEKYEDMLHSPEFGHLHHTDLLLLP